MWAGTRVGMVPSQEGVGPALPSSNMFDDLLLRIKPSILPTLYPNLVSTNDRRDKLCHNFALKAEKHDKFKKWFKLSDPKQDTRQTKFKYCDINAKHSRFKKSPLGHLTRMLNVHYNKK